MTDAGEWPSNGRCPATISYRTAPSAQMSLRASASRPSTCSGAMYCTVPRIVPCAVSGAAVASRVIPDIEIGAAAPRSFATPKSSSFAPDLISMILAGLRSRWTMPALCAAPSALVIWAAI